MSHYVQVIIAPNATANGIARQWPELARLDWNNGFSLFPVDSELIDAKIAPDETPASSGDAFILLTDGFRKFLQQLSRDGELAYVETDYFGGVGGQGALVCRNGQEVMAPTWSNAGTINEALELIGLEQEGFSDRFEAVGLGRVRDNDGILNLIETKPA